MSDFHNDPVAALDEMERKLVESRLLKETMRAGGNGSKTAAKKLRKITYQVQILGKHFRDLSVVGDDSGKRRDTVAKFSAKWAKIMAPTRRKAAEKKAD